MAFAIAIHNIPEGGERRRKERRRVRIFDWEKPCFFVMFFSNMV
jgi:hypothetical protein